MIAGRTTGLGVPLALGFACLTLGAAVYDRIAALGSIALPPRAAPPLAEADAPLPAEPTLSPPARETFAAILERPIFAQSRRPPQAAAETAAPAPAPSLDLDLTGVVIWRAQRLALVRPKKASADIVQVVAEGGTVGGWSVVTIEPRRVVLRNGKIEKEIRLEFRERAVDD